jgi:hypothetical protein
VEVSVVQSVTLRLPSDEAVVLRRVLDTAILPEYDTEGEALRKNLANRLTGLLYYPGNVRD